MNEKLLIIKLPDFNLNCSAQQILILKIQILQLYQKLLSLYFTWMPCTEFSKCQHFFQVPLACEKQINQKGPWNLIKLMKRCIKGNHHQAMPIQRINLPCKPKEITSKEKLGSENQFLNIKLANHVKLVRQRLSEGPIGSLLSGHK
ncbi:Hypothetical_protein [Hexamita inflata]|uniref:Hypothetical_protein n=1 Tax=Hexamita inflata TaxID=28002 RepID=A0ABP1H754_9EUKA